jgi:methylmalonyl-CoA mutase
MGPPRQHKTRADFAASFFQVGGFRVIENRAFPSIDTAAEAASHSGAPIVVICSTDETYPEIVPPLAGKIKADSPDVILVLAGFPEEHVEAFKEAGVDAFIHIRANCYETLRGIVERMGLNL